MLSLDKILINIDNNKKFSKIQQNSSRNAICVIITIYLNSLSKVDI